MDEIHEQFLREKWSLFRKYLEPHKLLPHLVAVLDNEDVSRIRAEKNRENECDLLIEILPRRGPKAFDYFLKALQKEGTQVYLADILIKELGKTFLLAHVFIIIVRKIAEYYS